MSYMRAALIAAGLAPDRPTPSRVWSCLKVRTTIDIGSKICFSCGERKPLDAYHREAKGKGGRRSYCKPCYLAYQRERRVA